MSAPALFDLHGKVALVTGGSRGLGKTIAEGLAEAGARIVISARRQEWLGPAEAELTGRGFACLAVQADVTQPAQVEALVGQTLARFGTIDVLVNNAGISWGAPTEEMPLERWRQVLDVNATGTFLVSQIAGRHMIARGRGKILNVASLAGLTGTPVEVLSAVGYSASKGAVIAFTRDLAVKWARHGITVNAIAPGFFSTRLTEAVLQRSEAEIIKGIPLRRLGGADDIKGITLFLASAASDYVTGQVIALDGGATAW
jgi:gluconate 5-dehydrogenase